uniref:Acylamino-acid-releasing enzyme n=1 Tax=Sinocyclocheilus grahami TaxID=75366 RepID=A0A672L7T0_SINGR
MLHQKQTRSDNLDNQGSLFSDQFGCMVWSHSETHLLYVAEKKRPKTELYFQVTNGPETGLLGQQFEYYEDWGEELVNKSSPVLCVLDIEGSNITVLEGIPTNISPGQAFWAPNNTGLVFVGWWHEPFRLGLKYCANRRSSLFYVDLASGKCEQLSSNSSAVCSPRLSPDNCRIVYLECGVFGPHQQCSRLCMYDWYTKQTRVVVDAVQRAREDGFIGIYSSMLSPYCWSAGSQRVLMSCAQRCHKVLQLLSHTRAAFIITRVGFLPAKGSENKMSWVTLEETQPQADISWQTLNFSPPPPANTLVWTFYVILLKPKEMTAGSKLPLIVMAHGSPHSVLVSEWFLSTAVPCKMGFSVLLGEEQLQCLPYTLKSVHQTHDLAFIHFFRRKCITREPYIRVHLLQAMEEACLDISVDACQGWISVFVFRCMVEAGYEYNTDIHLEPAILEQMLNKSPIKHVSKVKTPVLLMFGEDDKLVPSKQGIEYYRALKALQVPVRLLWYPGNNHSLSKVDAESDGLSNIFLCDITSSL